MAEHTTDPTDSRLTHGVDDKPMPQAEAYLVLSEEERADGFVRLLRTSYRHVGTEQSVVTNGLPNGGCGVVTTMSRAIAETYAKYPAFYGATYCTGCSMHLPVNEFIWVDDGSVVGS
jgi:hypothetical protein